MINPTSTVEVKRKNPATETEKLLEDFKKEYNLDAGGQVSKEIKPTLVDFSVLRNKAEKANISINANNTDDPEIAKKIVGLLSNSKIKEKLTEGIVLWNKVGITDEELKLVTKTKAIVSILRKGISIRESTTSKIREVGKEEVAKASQSFSKGIENIKEDFDNLPGAVKGIMLVGVILGGIYINKLRKNKHIAAAIGVPAVYGVVELLNWGYSSHKQKEYKPFISQLFGGKALAAAQKELSKSQAGFDFESACNRYGIPENAYIYLDRVPLKKCHEALKTETALGNNDGKIDPKDLGIELPSQKAKSEKLQKELYEAISGFFKQKDCNYQKLKQKGYSGDTEFGCAVKQEYLRLMADGENVST